MIKRLLTIILTLIFALSSVATLATEEVPAEDISVEEIETLEPVAEEAQEEEISLEPMADATTGGVFASSLVETYKPTEFTDNYDVLPSKNGTSKYVGQLYLDSAETQGFKIAYPYGSASVGAAREQSYDAAPFKTETDNPYLKLYLPADNVSNVGPTFIYELGGTGMIQGEKVCYSMDVRNDDAFFNKAIIMSTYFKPYNGAYFMRFVELGTDGKITFEGVDDTAIPYAFGQWYHLDIVFEFTSVTSTTQTGTIYYYIDGNLVAKATDYNFQTLTNGTTKGSYWDYVGFLVDTKKPAEGITTTTARSSDSAIFADNFSAKIVPADQGVSVTKKSSPYYNNFSTPAAVSDSAVYSFTEVAPTLSKGVYGKAEADASLKSVITASADAFAILSPSLQAAVNSNNLTAGQQIKLSQSFAYASNSGNVYANLLANTETVNLIKMTNDGSLYLAGTDTNVNLAPERWYNLDAIITVESDLDLLVDLYINGILAANGTITYDEAYTTEANTINIAKIVFGADAASETYYDDVYVNTFSGTGDDVATPNASITESSDLIDTADEIGKALVDPGMLLDDFVAAISSDANIKMYKDGTEAVSGYAAGTLAVSGEETYLPTYCYVYATVVLDDPTFTAGTGKVTVSTNVASMLSNPRTITLLVATYVEGDDGISRIYSVKPQTIDCIGQTNEYSIDAVIPETYFDTVRPEPSADSSASEDETTEEPEVLKAPAEKVSIKVFTTTGWDENLPAFGDTWTVTLYDLLKD